MGDKQHKYCDLCAAGLASALDQVVIQERATDGHAFAGGTAYSLCDGCAETVAAWLAKQKAAADVKWDRKDPTKVDRAATYMARYIAKNVVKAGLADACEVQLSYVIGGRNPLSVLVDTFGTGKLSNGELVKLIAKHFSLNPSGIIDQLELRRPIFSKTAIYGHFGREEPEFTWEKTDKADALRRDAGL